MTEPRSIPIASLIPQRPPFIMVDRLLSCDATDAMTEFTVSGGCVFLDDGKLSAAGVMENMAQSCAARIGYLNTMKGEPVKIGLIGDIRGFSLSRQPLLGERINTRVHIVEDVLGLTLAEVTAEIGGEAIASAVMKIATVDKAGGSHD